MKTLKTAVAMLCVAAPLAHADMYRWVDEQGSVVLSTQQPPDSAALKDFTVIKDAAPPPAPELRAKEATAIQSQSENFDRPIVQRDADALRRDVETTSPSADAAKREAQIGRRDSEPLAREPKLVPRENDTAQHETDAAKRITERGKHEPEPLVREVETIKRDPAPAPRPVVRADRPEAVQDPCLTSSDRNCYQKYRDYYVPGRGFSPTAARAVKAEPQANTGGSSSAAAGGVVAGGSVAPQGTAVVPPRHSQVVSTTVQTKTVK